ncbi:Uncharacterised protein [Mycobacteroides abscessus subsp. abscessus]|nr:Uncharacterised protein [Mycobacteroides abscessus subsp. abscessus]
MPTGTVDLPMITDGSLSSGASESTTACTYFRSAAYSPFFWPARVQVAA